MESEFEITARSFNIPAIEVGDEKEAFSFLGLALFESIGLERSVMQLLTMAEMGISTETNLDIYDQVYAKYAKMTLGQLRHACEKSASIDKDLIIQIEHALPVRNQIMHRLAWDSAELFCTVQGRSKLIDGLRRDLVLLASTLRKIETVVIAQGQQLGITEERIRAIEKQLLLDSGDAGDDAVMRRSRSHGGNPNE